MSGPGGGGRSVGAGDRDLDVAVRKSQLGSGGWQKDRDPLPPSPCLPFTVQQGLPWKEGLGGCGEGSLLLPGVLRGRPQVHQACGAGGVGSGLGLSLGSQSGPQGSPRPQKSRPALPQPHRGRGRGPVALPGLCERRASGRWPPPPPPSAPPPHSAVSEAGPPAPPCVFIEFGNVSLPGVRPPRASHPTPPVPAGPDGGPAPARPGSRPVILLGLPVGLDSGSGWGNINKRASLSARFWGCSCCWRGRKGRSGAELPLIHAPPPVLEEP